MSSSEEENTDLPMDPSTPTSSSSAPDNEHKQQRKGQNHRVSILRGVSKNRSDYLTRLMLEHETLKSESKDSPSIDRIEEEDSSPNLDKKHDELEDVMLEDTSMKVTTKRIEELNSLMVNHGIDVDSPEFRGIPIETKIESFSFVVPVKESSGKIMTVYNSSVLYSIVQFCKRLIRGEVSFRLRNGNDASSHPTKKILDDISLIIEPGKSYLLLGPPGAGRTTLLKSIAGQLRPSANEAFKGSISYNGRTLEVKGDFYIENAIAYIDQLDKHAPRLTVEETFAFACNCKLSDSRRHLLQTFTGSKMLASLSPDITVNKYADNPYVKLVLLSLGLTGVKDTFVGDATVRGVSGGQRRRVTVGEMIGQRASVLCGDEISTGLDAASTYDMISTLVYFGKTSNLTRLISLLQPSPETVSLFDELIVMAEGMLIYAGPVGDVENYFADLGFKCPQFVDVADFLQMICTNDNIALYDPDPSQRDNKPVAAPTLSELAEIFRQSALGRRIREQIAAPSSYVWSTRDFEDLDPEKGTGHLVKVSRKLSHKYSNSFLTSAWLILHRFLTLWIRDRRVIIASAVKNIIMGISVGGCYLSTTNSISIQGALFQAGLFIILGSMQTASSLVTDRVIFYKHTDANFYSAWPYVVGRIGSQLPQVLFDTIMFATLLYYMVGLAGRESAANFFVYLSLLFMFALLMNQQMASFASFASAGALSAISACIVLLLVLFGGFIIVPDTIPMYYSWIYWWNPFAWIYRALIVNEFYSARWGTDTDQILTSAGFVGYDGLPYGKEWIAYAFAFCIPYWILCSSLTALGLTYCRSTEGSRSFVVDAGSAHSTSGSCTDDNLVLIPFKPANLAFRDVCYDVTASTSSAKLRLLNQVSGIFRERRLCALMGSSGAGKTTLMDVLAIRKRTGTVTGSILLNGWPQKPDAFRRCSGFVYQFDNQSPELTVYETIEFSARLRLDPEFVTDNDQLQQFLNQVMSDVELTNLKDSLVGTDESFGLSFEQKKRLSIAVELAASPSILFLDEPTSGLDARSALLVTRTLRSIADSGRTVVATIHQPSSAVFNMFDDLLLLKTGGKVVFNGELGDNSCHLISYFEALGAPRIELGDNPANWMLRVMDFSEMNDLADSYIQSSAYASLCKELDGIAADPDTESKISYLTKYAASASSRRNVVNLRLMTIYWRSPSYNLSRLVVSLVIAFVLGSVFIVNRNPPFFSESEMRARLSVIFLTFIITGIQAIISVLPVMTSIRDIFYLHRDAGMYDSKSVGLALGVAEKWFIVYASTIFTTVFLATSGIANVKVQTLRSVGARCIGFWGFFTFNFAIYSYFGQLFVCLVKPAATAFILCSVFIGLNNFFSGLVVLPQYMVGTFYAVPYWITPGHFVYDGLISCVYKGNTDAVLADAGGLFNEYLISLGVCSSDSTTPCQGTAEQYVKYFFGGQFMITYPNGFTSNMMNAIILGFILILTRALTFVALRYIHHGA